MSKHKRHNSDSKQTNCRELKRTHLSIEDIQQVTGWPVEKVLRLCAPEHGSDVPAQHCFPIPTEHLWALLGINQHAAFPKNGILNAKEAAVIYGCSRDEILKRMEDGHFGHQSSGGVRQVPLLELLQVMSDEGQLRYSVETNGEGRPYKRILIISEVEARAKYLAAFLDATMRSAIGERFCRIETVSTPVQPGRLFEHGKPDIIVLAVRHWMRAVAICGEIRALRSLRLTQVLVGIDQPPSDQEREELKALDVDMFFWN